WRRQIRFRAEPIPSGWFDILDRCVPLARGLAADERERLLRLAQVFLAEKHVEGCGGLVVTKEMRVTIAAEACLLLLHLEGPCYPTLRTDRKSTRLNSSHVSISYAVFCLKKKCFIAVR